MNKIYLFSFCLIALVVLMSNKGGRASSEGQGSTGAPGESQTCKNCHNGNTVVDLSLFVLDGNDTIKSYEPGKSYVIDVVINYLSGPVPKGYGFQITGLIAALNKTGDNIKTITAVSSNVKTATANNGRLYAEHKGVSGTNTFRVGWTAPEAGLGALSFYAAGNGVNANNNESGDGSSKISKQLEEKIPTSTTEQLAAEFKVYPNPGSGDFYIKGKNAENTKSVNVLNILGKKILQVNYAAGMNLDLKSIQDGIYLIQFLDFESRVLRTQKIFKRSEKP